MEPRGLVDAVHAQCRVEQDREYILPKIDQMREDISRVIKAPQALKSTPNRREALEEPKESGVIRIALRDVRPVVCVKAEEQLDVLLHVSFAL